MGVGAVMGLRGYQQECINYVHKAWDDGVTRVPSVLATGAGKTVIFTHPLFLDRFLDNGQRVLILAHTDELCAQAVDKARRANPTRTVGIVKADLNETHAQIVVASVQTLRGAKRVAQLKRVGVIVVDECHHAVATSYRAVLEHFGAFDGRVKVAGFTATLSRGDRAKLSTVWEEPGNGVFRRDILYMIRNGFLLDVRGERVIVPDLTMSNVKKSGGDFQDASLAEELERTFAPQIVAEKYASVARDGSGTLRAGIAFWPLVETAYHGAEAFVAAGIPSAVIHGGLPKEERKLILKRFAAGDITVVHNCMVLTEGFDAPWADVVVIGRPTRNGGLYQQMVGRVLRPDLTIPAEQREKALILDVTGAGANNDLRCLIDLSPEHLAGKDYEDGDSLLDLEEEWLLDEQSAGGSIELETEIYLGPAETVSFDPLHRDRVWTQTPGGTFFTSAGTTEYVFLSETLAGEPGTYDVVWLSKKGVEQAGALYQGIALEDAMLLAEDAALERGGHGAKTLASRKKAWRREEPSDSQKLHFGYLITPGMSKGEVSELIDASMAARRIDPFVKRMKGAST
jgi:superfamily II DNA or RNA helicase